MLKSPDADVIADVLAPANRRYSDHAFRHAGARASPDADATAAAYRLMLICRCRRPRTLKKTSCCRGWYLAELRTGTNEQGGGGEDGKDRRSDDSLDDSIKTGT